MTTISQGASIDAMHDTRFAMGERTISLAERMRVAAPEAPAGAPPDPEEELDPVKLIFDMFFADYQEKLQGGDEEETGMVTLEVDY